jgi:hypothetical protein
MKVNGPSSVDHVKVIVLLSTEEDPVNPVGEDAFRVIPICCLIVCGVSFIVCVDLCAVFCLSVVCYFV